MAQQRAKGVAMPDANVTTEQGSRGGEGAKPMVAPLDWTEFEGRLAGALARLADDQYLVLAQRPAGRESSYFVQFAQTGTAGFLAEAVSNDYLAGDRRISPAQELQMLALGWLGPSKHAKGPENYRREWPVATPFEEVATLAVRTLREVYGVAEPADLRYQRFARADGRPIPEPSLGLEQERKRRKKAPGSGRDAGGGRAIADLAALILEGVRIAAAKLEALESVKRFDSRTWTAMLEDMYVWVKILVDDDPMLPQAVRVYVPALEVPESAELLRALNRMNAGLVFGRLLHVNEDVFVSVELPIRGLTAAWVAEAAEATARTALRVRGELTGAVQRIPAPAGSVLPN